MLTTTLVAIQTLFCTALPPQAIEFNTFLLQHDEATETPRYFGPQNAGRSYCLHPAHAVSHPSVYPVVRISPGKGIKQSQFSEKDYRIKTVVIDPGHGGHDPGCLGASHQEKHLALAISKQLAAAMKTQFPDLRIIMTRETDVFVPLHERARIANQHEADLFISIHCNFMPGSSATKGSETYVMGLHTAEQNLEVAKRENAAILLEENYEQHYDFDPNSPEGHILLSMFQNAHLEQSILLAERVEAQFHAFAGRKSRGVKQAGFYVLKATTMPSILIEAGFLSNREEEQFLSTAAGQETVANGILLAFAEYKSMMERGRILAEAMPQVKPTAPPPPDLSATPQAIRVAEQTTTKSTPLPAATARPLNEVPRNTSTAPVVQFCVQLAAASKPLSPAESKWRGLRYPVEVVQESNLYKYQARGFTDLEAALQAKIYLQSQGFADAFIVAYKNDQRITLDEAKRELGIRY
ncbi:MAG TPA: N-acetylmuramoyl-L-alanine amidase [Saprospiraceae bacterium]|nr:N-acetylmuramoyl-L-alanine amidase [Saprospiraceae bacterium]HMP24530.1 N-acetylmuramoyl-L-alanine amidase [Saprospiraceae bacterium]